MALITIFSSGVKAQVLEPSWLYGKITQKKLKEKTSNNRSVASYHGLQVRHDAGWKFVENKPETMNKKILLLPGFLGTDYGYHEMLHDPEMEKNGVKLIAANAPGFAGLPVPKNFDFSIQSYAVLVEQMAEKEKISILVGHSYMATVLGEVARRGHFKGAIVMISPALESDDEPLSTRALDLITRDPLMKDIAWIGMYAYLEQSFSDFFQPGDQRHIDGAAAEARKTPIPFAQIMLKQYFNYLRSDDYTVMGLSQTPAEIHYLYGGKDVVQLKAKNKVMLKASGKVKFHYYPNASHMLMIDEAKKLNRLLLSL